MSERHEKWVRVEPGTFIPAGQPYRVIASEHVSTYGFTAIDAEGEYIEIDSTRKPPLVLPTEPTWGIAVTPGSRITHEQLLGQWSLRDDRKLLTDQMGYWGSSAIENVLDFIPLTDEQVARIEARR